MKVIKGILKFILAGITAVAILCVVTSVYSFTPLRETSKYKNTDYVWTPNTPWMTMSEGISFGMTDAQGFINQKVVDNPDVILVGSSHAEAKPVLPSQSVSTLLTGMLDKKHTVYNMSISGHTPPKLLRYMPKTLTAYDNPPKYVLVELTSTELYADEINDAINGDAKENKVNNEGIVAKAQYIPFFRQMYHKWEDGLGDMLLPKNTAPSAEKKAEKKLEASTYKTATDYIRSLELQYGTKIILWHHPKEILNTDGTLSFMELEATELFEQAAKESGVTFVNLQPEFEKMYTEEHHVAHGFITGELATGHLNSYGHAAAAEKLYKTIMELDGE